MRIEHKESLVERLVGIGEQLNHLEQVSALTIEDKAHHDKLIVKRAQLLTRLNLKLPPSPLMPAGE